MDSARRRNTHVIVQFAQFSDYRRVRAVFRVLGGYWHFSLLAYYPFLLFPHRVRRKHTRERKSPLRRKASKILRICLTTIGSPLICLPKRSTCWPSGNIRSYKNGFPSRHWPWLARLECV